MKKRTACSIILLWLLVPSLVFAIQLTKIERLGKIMYQDKDFSRNKTQSCQTCHHHISGFADPTNLRDPENTVVSLGDDGVSLGGRNAPSSAYCGFSPPLQEVDGQIFGGLFWDGRADGSDPDLLDPLAQQAQGPPLNPVEMNMEDAAAVVEVVRNSSYRTLFLNVFGRTALDDDEIAFDYIAQAIAAYERSAEVQRFSSRFDLGDLNAQEMAGLQLVQENCSACHSTTSEEGWYNQTPPAPLFTNYTYANIGIPVNPLLADNDTDLGLGGYTGVSGDDGKFKVPTLRNVAFTAPYGHNGYFATLRAILEFKNDRDGWLSSHNEIPEVDYNLNMDVGYFDFSDEELDAIIAFLRSLTD